MNSRELPRVSDYDDSPLDMQLKLAAMVDYQRGQIQRNTVKQLNDLTPENNGRVRAAAVTDDVAAELCGTDSAHGPGTVVFMVCGELFELCPGCAVRVIDGMLRDGRVVSDSNDLIDVEVHR